mmetsp:Transcript_9839/g.19631  ORF Transcript_9839/g.19631 Transcript_9839/m.19631 type:complete len:158 (-) Transcript_9839:491-964(-)|eukprot:CAMPEP_0181290202 /NCGR_PEP_ID=MMETSP1101-20121128/1291_1 /TAXON_ID=46948 /ORGANISM="Rhodomonas abbreviata, Strain Caron Lab Isolate" /LENGTH=157 /DNA_ID=CAMNT_0023394477 /DNA_START=92 /DNA_END=565 /DNA_ORIENTATION=-
MSAAINAEIAQQNLARNAEEKQRRMEVEDIFRMMDTDSDGYLSVEDANRVGRMLGLSVPERHSVNVRGVSLPQFLGWVTGLASARDYETEVTQAFTLMKDKKGFITPKRMADWLKQNKIECSQGELDELMEFMNGSDDDRGISYDDFVNFYNQYHKK